MRIARRQERCPVRWGRQLQTEIAVVVKVSMEIPTAQEPLESPVASPNKAIKIPANHRQISHVQTPSLINAAPVTGFGMVALNAEAKAVAPKTEANV